MIPLGTVPFGTVLLNKKQRLDCKSLLFFQVNYKTEPNGTVPNGTAASFFYICGNNIFVYETVFCLCPFLFRAYIMRQA